MNKRLPRTTNRTLDDLREAARAALDAERPMPAARPETPARPAQRAAKPGPAPRGAANHDPASQGVAVPQGPVGDGDARAHRHPTRAQFKEASARLIIERHVNLAGMAGLVPLPWVDLAVIAAVVERMLRKLSRLYGAPLGTDRSARLAAAMLGGMAATGIAGLTTASLFRWAPGPHLVGMAIMSISAAVLVRIIGDVFLNRMKSEARIRRARTA